MMSRDPLLPRREQFSSGQVGQAQFQAALITYQAAIIVVLRQEVGAFKFEIEALKAEVRRDVESIKFEVRSPEDGNLLRKHERFLNRATAP